MCTSLSFTFHLPTTYPFNYMMHWPLTNNPRLCIIIFIDCSRVHVRFRFRNSRLARFQIPGRDVCGEMRWELPLEVYTVNMEGGQLAYNYKHTLLLVKSLPGCYWTDWSHPSLQTIFQKASAVLEQTEALQTWCLVSGSCRRNAGSRIRGCT